jgi:hypothetical protein
MTDIPNNSASQNAASAGASLPKKKSKIGKIIKRTILALVLVIVVALVALYFMRNSLVKAGVEFGGKYATEQITLLDVADLSLGGTLDLSQLKIHNPGDTKYKEPQFLKMKSCNVKVEPLSLLGSTVVVEEIAIDGLEITVEQNGVNNNLADLMAIMQKKSSSANPAPAAGGASAPAPAQSPGKSLQIKKIHLSKTVVHFRVSGVVPFSLDFDLGPIELIDITNPDGRSMKLADVMVKVLMHVAQGITKEVANNKAIPDVMKTGLKDVSKMVDGLKGELDKSIQKGLGAATGVGKQIEKEVNKQIENIQKDLPKVPGLPTGLPNLLGGGTTTKP